jgi:hypothetical protein
VGAQHPNSTHDSLKQIDELRAGEFVPGSAIKILDPVTGIAKTLIAAPEGTVRSPCLHFDGKRMLFAMRHDAGENFHIFEIGTDGKNLRQLTTAPDVSDVDPIYMPDDSIVFASTRERKYVPCAVDIVTQLFRMGSDGENIRQITKATAHEQQISLMPDGRVFYTRWDYVDRNFGDGHGFWAVNPDGTNPAVLWGNNTGNPSAGWSGRIIPGSNRILCILGTHHGVAWGSLAILDPKQAIDGTASIVRTWPADVVDRFDNDHGTLRRETFDLLRGVFPKYDTPWPLSDSATGQGAGKYFVCSRTLREKGPKADFPEAETGLYLIDVFGNQVLLHTEAPGCFSPIPIQPRSRPVMVPSSVKNDESDGFFFVQNVYEGTHMENVKLGAVKRIRVVEAISKHGLSLRGSAWGGHGGQTPGVNWDDFTPKCVIGTAPVEADGSAYFAVPSDRFVYFQLLDENGMMVQSMRSGTSVRPGATQGCVGCHESRLSTSPNSPFPRAMNRKPSTLGPWCGPERPFNYLTEVQPVLDKHCVSCHDIDQAAESKIVLAGDKNPSFNISYMELWSKGFVEAIGAGPAAHQKAYSWGSHNSKLIEILRKGHYDVKLDPESLDRLITWVDINGPYYPTTYSAYHDVKPGRCPLTPEQLGRLLKLLGVKQLQTRITEYRQPLITFDRPELSPCLDQFEKDSPEYAETLELIRAGQANLKAKPRADMPGFVPWEKDLERQEHLAKYHATEQRVREAIREGRKVFDSQ